MKLVLEECNLNQVFTVITGLLVALGLAVIVVSGLPLQLLAVLKLCCWSSLLTGAFVSVIAIRRAASWLTWDECAGVLGQSLVALLILWGLLSRRPTVSVTESVLILGWICLVLASSWGLLKNRWWAYFGESVALVAASLFFIGVVYRSNGRQVTLDVMGLLLVFSLIVGELTKISSLLKRGFVRWNERNGAEAKVT